LAPSRQSYSFHSSALLARWISADISPIALPRAPQGVVSPCAHLPMWEASGSPRQILCAKGRQVPKSDRVQTHSLNTRSRSHSENSQQLSTQSTGTLTNLRAAECIGTHRKSPESMFTGPPSLRRFWRLTRVCFPELTHLARRP